MFPERNPYDNTFQMYVAWVDHGETLDDKQTEGVLSPYDGRNYHIGGYRLNRQGNGGPLLTVVVPQEVAGSFKVPQLGDIVWIEEVRRDVGTQVTYVYSTYNDRPLSDRYMPMPVPQWGARPHDFGHLRSYREHIRQFSPQIDGNFVTKYVTHITGYRFRSFYRGNLQQGKFAVRGDGVFDIHSEASRPYIISDGVDVGYGTTLESDKGKYPDPNNVPETREENADYTYNNLLHNIISQKVNPDPYAYDSKASPVSRQIETHILKNKGYTSYQPILDKKYLDYAKFERELPATEEYQVALRGNNKLLIQDQYGDGEQLLITLKSQYDEQFTIIHNGDKGQIRIRDNLGQGVLIEGDEDAPRIVTWTKNNQRIEQGSVKGKGSFTYIRNGEAFGDSNTSYGTKTGLTKGDVPNQEFLMVSTSDIIGELGSRLSPGLNSFVSSCASPGVYLRNNADSQPTEQTMGVYQSGGDMTITLGQSNSGFDGSTQSSSIVQTMDGSAVTQTTNVHHTAPGVEHQYTETTTVDSSSATKTSTLERVGKDTITSVDSISGDNTGSSTKTILLPNSNQITISEDGATPSVDINVKAAGSNVADYMMDATNIVTTKYDSTGAPLHKITQANGTVDIAREAAGLAATINVGADSGTGLITIGNVEGDTLIAGRTLALSGVTSSTLSAADVSISSNLTTGTTSIKGNTVSTQAEDGASFSGKNSTSIGETGKPTSIKGTTNFTP